jgi:glycosyltransferase involved in cell wall biosynthesis
MCAVKLGVAYSKPSYIAYGESSDWSVKNHTRHFIRRIFSYVNGVIAVSTKNKEVLTGKKFCVEQKIGVFMNGVKVEHFYPRDKKTARSQLGLDNKFIVAFVGHFINRKGILELSEAVSEIDDVGLILAGKGPLSPSGQHILYKGLVVPELMPYFLSAADAFVLPSKNEGCSNAILEAMACGLPVISSNLSFNYDILDESCSILVDPENVDDIRDAILRLKNNPELRERLAQGSLEKVKAFSVSKRAKDILTFMDEMTQEGTEMEGIFKKIYKYLKEPRRIVFFCNESLLVKLSP